MPEINQSFDLLKNGLPNEIRLLVFSLVELTNYRTIACCCKSYNKFLKDEQLWRIVCDKLYSESYLSNFPNHDIDLMKRLKYYNNVKFVNWRKSLMDHSIFTARSEIHQYGQLRNNKIIQTTSYSLLNYFIIFDKPLSTKYSFKFKILNTEKPILMGFANNYQNFYIGKLPCYSECFLIYCHVSYSTHQFTCTRTINRDLSNYLIPDLVKDTVVEFNVLENTLIMKINDEEFKIQINREMYGVVHLNLTNMYPYLYANSSDIQIL